GSRVNWCGPKFRCRLTQLPVRNTLRNNSGAFLRLLRKAEKLVTAPGGPELPRFSWLRARDRLQRCSDRSPKSPEHSSELDVAKVISRRVIGRRRGRSPAAADGPGPVRSAQLRSAECAGPDFGAFLARVGAVLCLPSALHGLAYRKRMRSLVQAFLLLIARAT